MSIIQSIVQALDTVVSYDIPLFHQQCLVQTVLFASKMLGYLIATFGVGLIVFCAVVSAREVAPLITTPGTLAHSAIVALTVVVSYCILFNYVCCATFSCRVGSGPLRGCVLVGGGAGSSEEDEGCREEEDAEGGEDAIREDNARPFMGGAATAVLRGAHAEGCHCAPRKRKQEGRFTLPASSIPAQHQQQQRRPTTPYCFRHCSSLCPCFSSLCMTRRATPAQLRELDHITCEGEMMPPTERRYSLLDAPRRFCVPCNRLKAPREHHCSICGVCVPKMDHHCPWINNCVDAENHRYFFSFVAWLGIGTLLEAGFLGYAFWVQHRYEAALSKALERNQKQEETRSGGTTRMPTVTALVAPFGPQGSKLTSFAVICCISLSVSVFLFMLYFCYKMLVLILNNTSSVEELLVEEKQARVYASTRQVFCSPYDLGAFRNVLETFGTAGDPVVGAAKANTAASSLLTARRGWFDRAWVAAVRGVMVTWIVLMPTLRGTGCDGMHYPTFYSEMMRREKSILDANPV